MGSTRGFVRRHVGVLLAVLISSPFVQLGPPKVTRPRVVLPEHEARIVEFSPDSRVMVTDGASGGCVRDAATGRVLVRLMRAGSNDPSPATEITWPRFTADGRHLIVQLGGPRFSPELTWTVTLAVFEAATGRECAAFEGVGSEIWWGLTLAPAAYALSADGSTLAFCRATDHRTSQVTVWDVAAEKVVAEFPAFPPLALAPDGSALAYDSRDTRAEPSSLTIRALRPGQSPATQVRGVGALTGLGAGAIAFSPDGKLLAYRVLKEGPGVEIEVRDVNSGQLRAAWNANRSRLSGFDPLIDPETLWFSPDARLLLLGDLRGHGDPPLIQCWDLSGESPRMVLKGLWEGFTPDGSRAAIATWDHTSRWSPVSRRHNNSDVEVFDLPESKPRARLVETEVHQATISPDGRILALPSDRKDAIERQGIDALVRRLRRAVGLQPMAGDLEDILNPPTVEVHEIRFLDAATGKFTGTIDRPARRDPERTPYTMTFSPDSKTLLVKYLPEDFGGWSSRNPMVDWSVELWDVPAGRRIAGSHSLVLALAATLLVFAGAWLDRRRARRVGADDQPATSHIDSVSIL
jgi:WD40 repeat protein